MDVKLMELKTRELLQKFGASNHKPGSGSAAAELGLVSAQLLRTVIGLTDKPKRQDKYSKWLPELRRIASEIDNRVLPALEKLFQTDSDQFDKAIQMRQRRDQENDIVQKSLLTQQAKKELQPATLIPIDIAKLCIELAEYAAYVFAHGFKSARGDAGVAQNAAIAATGGCLSIIYLNLLSFNGNTWTNQIREELVVLWEKYQQLSSEAIHYIDALKKETDEHYQCQFEINKLIDSLSDETKLTDIIIEKVARDLQLLLWKHKNTIWKYDEIDNPLEILQPDTVLQTMGYLVNRPKFLEPHQVDGELFEVAGIIDKEQKFVQISRNFKLETQNFTAAHELGHALFHKHAVLHRDRPLDGSPSNIILDTKEKQANKFAACFLMPKKQVLDIFKQKFSIDKFTATKDIIFTLTKGTIDNVETFKATFATKRDVSRFFGKPLAETFQVSIETMAIRLEELELIDY